MKVALTTLSNQLYSESRAILCESALLNGVDKVYDFDFEDVKKSDFYESHHDVLSNERFMGYWLWKPYIISKALEDINYGDILFYIDAGVKVLSSLKPLVEICSNESDIVVCGNGNDINASWTKRDCFVLMDCDSERFWYSAHCDASFVVFKKTEKSIDFVNEWVKYGSNLQIISNLPNVSDLPNKPEFIDHRYDQSILSLLAEKFNLPLYRAPSQFGNHYKLRQYRIEGEFNCLNQSYQNQLTHYHFLPYYNSVYGQLVDHHRTKNKAYIQDEKVPRIGIDLPRDSNQKILFTRIMKMLRNLIN
ncbi:MAG TPA: hypothetical protein VF629_09660 [Hymenobacter sp.]|jgi:hypothetical protein|uniref:hypothetical protein n=1 Tax=Hymenobacter sp. TaxID=1898978 RepID=UPI002ED86A32